MPGNKAKAIHKSRRHVYEKIKKKEAAKGVRGRKLKAKAAAIANAGKTAAGRKRMARKAAATRKRRGK